MKETLEITSTESLDSAIAETVRLRIKHKAKTAEMETEKAAIGKRYAAELGRLNDEIAEKEGAIHGYCVAHRTRLFAEKKSRETLTAVVGFEFTPYRVETTSRKVTWKEVIKRLLRVKWGLAYIRTPAAVPDKDAMLKDREKLTPEQCTAAGIVFERDEQFFIRPKSEIAEASTQEVA